MTHINMKYIVWTADNTGDSDTLEFLSSAEFLGRGISTAMKKVMKVVEGRGTADKKSGKESTEKDPKQRSIASFFKPKV